MDVLEAATEITKAWLAAMSTNSQPSWLLYQINAEKVAEFYQTIYKAVADAPNAGEAGRNANSE